MGSRGWGIYFLVFLSGAVSLLLPLLLWVTSSVLARKEGRSSMGRPFETAAHGDRPLLAEPGKRINARFYLALNSALILMGMAILGIPSAVVVKGGGIEALFSVVTLTCFLSLALFYSARKGDLSWLRSYRDPGPVVEESENEE